MENKTTINLWDNLSSSNFVKFEKETLKTIVITEWKLSEVEKVFEGKASLKIQLSAKCLEEDGKRCEKELNTVSNPLLLKLKGILAEKDNKTKVRLQIMKMGEGKATLYSVKQIE